MVFGVGGVGLNVLQALKVQGASTIVGVDTEPKKEALARQFGATHFLDGRAEDIVNQIAALRPYSDSQVREKAAIALGASGDERAISALTKAMKDSDSQVREKAIAGLVLLGIRPSTSLRAAPSHVEGRK